MSSKAVLKELHRRVNAAEEAAKAPKFELAKFFFEKQFKFFRGTNNRFKVAVCSRRAGKTVGIVGDALDICLTNPGARVLYVTLTRENCLEIIWPDLLETIEKYQIKCKINYSRLTVTFPNKSYFACAGAKDKVAIGKFRGRKLRRIYIDEAQNFPGYMKTMIEDDLMPTLRDLRGEMVVTGTPGPLKRGFFYDIASNGRWESHNWTAYENPHLHNPPEKDYDVTLAEEREVKGIDKNDPAYVRETYGVWTESTDSLVFKFNRELNIGKPVGQGKMVYIFGIDIGYNDADAIAVLGYNFTDNKVYLVEEHIKPKQNITQLMQAIDTLKAKYEPVKMVMDAGGLGKKIHEELRPRYGEHFEIADKNRKFEFIELLNDDLRTGRFQAIASSHFEEDCYLVQWDRSNEDPTKLVISKSFHSDICDAVLYAWRECRHYYKNENTVLPAPNTDAYMDLLEQKEADALEAKKNKDELGVEEGDLESLFGEESEWEDDFR